MTEPARCQSCGLPLDPPVPGGHCPRCLLQMGLAEVGGTGGGGDIAGTKGDSNRAASVPGVIGPYHLLQVLGEGGMGLVYLAEQREPLVRRVALKLIKPGMATREVLARFEAERHALALMDHPGIARVLDAGLGPGDRPYFVMEYVAGVPITDYCDRHRLPNAERLQIFLQVCAALQHAHQKGIIHRDLKPSNILVTVQDGKPVPKVIDFGIAKATRQGSVEHAAFTRLGMLIGTPEYISPEQAEASGLEVDTTTDIYSLGVVLYELLTGVLPFDGDMLRGAGYAEMQRIIREQDPPKPSLRVTQLGATGDEAARHRQTTPPALGKQLRGDLDAIAMKAMEKDRTRRYASASEFAADISRYLNGEAVVASPPSALYRSRKFVRRHRLGVAAGALMVSVLVIGLLTSTLFYIRSEGARRAEERQRVVAERRGCQAAMLAADVSLRAGAASDARVQLDDCAEPLRGWEWRVLDRRTAASGRTFELDGPSRHVTFEDDATVRALVLGWKDGKYLMRVATANLANPAATLTTRPEESVIALSGDKRFAVVTNAVTNGATGLNDPVTGARALVAKGQEAGQWFVHLREMASGRTVSSLDLSGLGRWPLPHRGRIDPGFATGVLGRRYVWADDATGDVGYVSGTPPYVVGAVFSADGGRVAAWSWANVIGVWDTATGRRVASLDGHTNGVTAAVFERGAERLVSASFDGTARVWNLSQGRQIAALPVPAGAWSVAVSPDDRWIAAGSADGVVRVWNGNRLDLAWSSRSSRYPIHTLGFSPDSRVLGSGGGDSAIHLWEAASGASLAVVRAHRGSTDALAFSADGLRLVSTGDDNTLRVTNLADAGLRVVGRHPGPATAVAFAPDGETLLSAGSDRTLRVWRASTGRLLRTMAAPAATKAASSRFNSSMAFALSRDGRFAATGLRNPSTAYVWDVATGEGVRSLDAHWDGAIAVAFTGDASRLVVEDNGLRRVWDLATGGLLATAAKSSRRLGNLIPLRNPERMLTTAGGLGILNTGTLTVQKVGAWDDTWAICAVDRGESRVVLASDTGGLSLARLDDGAAAGVLRRSGPGITSCAYSPDGRRIAVSLWDGTIELWDATSLDQTLRLTTESISVAPGTGLAVESEFKLRLPEPTAYATSLAFSPDGSKLASAWSDGAIWVWNGSPKSGSQRAHGVVDSHFDKGALSDDVASTIQADNAISPDIRAEAARLAGMHVDDPSDLNKAAWHIVRSPGRNPAEYALALRRALKAAAARPVAGELNTLGAAQYRTGSFRDAIATLKRAEAVRTTPSPLDLVFVAMARYKLGEVAEAREALDRLRNNWNNADDADLKALWAEAEALFASAPSQRVKK